MKRSCSAPIKFQAQAVVSFRFLTNFRQVFAYPKIEMCQFLNLTGINPDDVTMDKVPMVSIFNQTSSLQWGLRMRNFWINAFPDKFHSCPLYGDDFKFMNFSSNNKHDLEKMMPDGDYRYEHKIWNDDDDLIFQAGIYERFKTGEAAFF